jgi:hypothetical protein
MMIDHMVNSRRDAKGGLKKALTYIKAEVSRMKAIIDPDPKAQEDYLQIMLDDFKDAPDIQRDIYFKELEKEYRAIISRVKQRPALLAKRSLELMGSLTGRDTTEHIREVEQAYMHEIGGSAIKAVLKGRLVDDLDK